MASQLSGRQFAYFIGIAAIVAATALGCGNASVSTDTTSSVAAPGTSGSSNAPTSTAMKSSVSTTTTTSPERPLTQYLYYGGRLVRLDGSLIGKVYGNEYLAAPWEMDFSDDGTVVHQNRSEEKFWLTFRDRPFFILQSPVDPGDFDTPDERITTAVISRDGTKVLAQFDQKPRGIKLKVMDIPDGTWRTIHDSEEGVYQPTKRLRWKADSNVDYVLFYGWYREQDSGKTTYWNYDYTRIHLLSVDTGTVVGTLEDSDMTTDLYDGIEASPDGSRIAYIRLIEPHDQVVVYDVQDGTAAVLYEAGGHYSLGDIHARIDHLHWSPDGTQLTATVWEGYETGDQVYLFSEDGSVTNLTENDSGRECSRAIWSPDGSMIAFLADGDQGLGLWTMKRDGSEKKLVVITDGTPLVQWREGVLPDLKYQ